MEYILSAVWILLELTSYLFLAEAFFQRYRKKWQIIIAVILAWAVIYAYSRLVFDGVIKLVLTICTVVALYSYLFKGSFWYHVLCIVLAYSIGAVVDASVAYGLSALIGISYAQLIERQLLYSIIGTIAKLAYVLFMYILWVARKSAGRQKLHTTWLLLTLLFPLISASMIMIIAGSYKDHADLSVGAFTFSCILAVSNIAILYLISVMEKSAEREKELTLLNQQMEIQTKNILALEKSHRAQRKTTHEFKHHLQTMRHLLAEGKIQTAQEYIEQLQTIQNLRIFNVDSHHPIVDAVLNQKYQEAKEQAIEMQIQINDLSKVIMKEEALVVLLSNLLDNAIEACMRFNGDRIICCNILASDVLYISVRNTSAPVTIINGMIETSKTSKLEHGYGMATIQHILKMFQAEYTFCYQDGWFQYVAEIPEVMSM